MKNVLSTFLPYSAWRLGHATLCPLPPSDRCAITNKVAPSGCLGKLFANIWENFLPLRFLACLNVVHFHILHFCCCLRVQHTKWSINLCTSFTALTNVVIRFSHQRFRIFYLLNSIGPMFRKRN